MNAYLKYFIGFKNGQAFVDSVECLEGMEPRIPDNFVKWHEEGDLDPKPLVDMEEVRRSASPGACIAFAPRKMSPGLIKLLKEKHGLD